MVEIATRKRHRQLSEIITEKDVRVPERPDLLFAISVADNFSSSNMLRYWSIFGRNNVMKEIFDNNKIWSESVVEKLFNSNIISFYTNENKTYLLSDNNELFEHDFGMLERIDGWQAYKIYGIEKLEEAKEKGYIRL